MGKTRLFDLEKHFAFYGAYHSNPVNIAIHMLFVRLAAHTAIQFYDVQDRLGYDRPSKAVDWLIKKAKAAIDELKELPSWNPHSISTTMVVPAMETRNLSTTGIHCFAAGNAIGSANRRTMVGSAVSEQQFAQNPSSNSTFLPLSLDSDAITDTIKTFVPIDASAAATTTEAPAISELPVPTSSAIPAVADLSAT